MTDMTYELTTSQMQKLYIISHITLGLVFIPIIFYVAYLYGKKHGHAERQALMRSVLEQGAQTPQVSDVFGPPERPTLDNPIDQPSEDKNDGSKTIP